MQYPSSRLLSAGGYRVGQRYGGNIYPTRTAIHPGETIILRIDIAPADR